MMTEAPVLSSGKLILMAFATGLIVANIYYCQPLVVLISKEFHVAESRAGSITFLTQLGYALGLLFLVPLGDRIERRFQIIVTSAFAAAALILAAIAPSLLILQFASFCIGFTSIIPQLILPLAAHLTLPEKRGKTVGTIMSGLLIGILLSRTLSGLVGDWLGWRSMFWIAAVITSALLFFMRYTFPESRPAFRGSYASLMRSLLTLLRHQPLLREASAINALGFAAFGMFWTTMVLYLSLPPFNFHSGTIGSFGLAAALGALAAPLIGGSADRSNPRIAIGYGLLSSLASFVVFYCFRFSVTGFVIGIVLLDIGMQSMHVSNQSRIYALLPEARNRLNTVYMTISFIGTSAGSAVGLWVWNLNKWAGVCMAGLLFIIAALLVYALTFKRTVKVLPSGNTTVQQG